MLKAGQAAIRTFRVIPNLPEALRPLMVIAHNLWWTWHPEAVKLFIRLDRDLWESTGHNPVKLLGMVDQELLDRVARDQSFLHALNMVYARFKYHMERASWFERQYAALAGARPRVDNGPEKLRIAYFSAEFGLTECLQIYSGGLGCLAGDHLKSASELGLPLCGVGLLYRCGYFHQYLNADGWQQETYPDLDFPNQPIRRLIDPATGEQYRVSIQLPGRLLNIGVWQLDVGRIPLYLLDTNLQENSREDRDITRNLYGGDIETRIKQELVLGVGGVKALAKIGERPTVYHLNEGHAAFGALEHIARIREESNVSFEAALQAAAAAHLFTTHTPVPAGIDRFSPELIRRYLEPMLGRLGINIDHLLGLGRHNAFDSSEFFSMAVLAIRTSQWANGVSALHGRVSRTMWQNLWPGVAEDEVPIGHITNGVHPRSWISPQLVGLYDRYLGPDWQLDPSDFRLWDAVNDIPDEELWRLRTRRKEKLITWCRHRIRQQLKNRGASHDEIERAATALDPDVFTIGFARRFATYKRGTLLLHDRERLRALFSNAQRPIQLLVAGKAHPADGPGKELIREIVKLASSEYHLARIVFLEDYDIHVGRWLVQSCDVWLNTPRRGMEASGTSGMKAAMNGVINVSILDGWWDEACRPSVGFGIGKGEVYEDERVQDAIESRALYDLLERQILPEFYDRDQAGLPRKWISRMKACMRELTPAFSTNRMVADYTEQYYLVAHGLGRSLMADQCHQAKDLASHITRLCQHWPGVAIRKVVADAGPQVPIRSAVTVRAEVELGGLRPDEVRVQIYHGEVTSLGDMEGCQVTDMHHQPGDNGSSRLVYTGHFEADASGRRGFVVRVIPRDDRIMGTLIPGLITWDQSDAGPLPSKAQSAAAISSAGAASSAARPEAAMTH